MRKKYLQEDFFEKGIFLMISVTNVIAVTVFLKLAIINIFLFAHRHVQWCLPAADWSKRNW